MGRENVRGLKKSWRKTECEKIDEATRSEKERIDR